MVETALGNKLQGTQWLRKVSLSKSISLDKA